MEDDEEIRSQPSPNSASPSQSPSTSPPRSTNGRITVTVTGASATGGEQLPENSLALAIAIQQPRPTAGAGGGGGGGGGREDCWSEGATAVLIDAWGERYLELSRGNLKQKHWKEVADVVGSRDEYTKPPKTDIQCKNRIDTVKKKYKLEKAKIAAGGPSKWKFYDKMDQLIGPTAKYSSSAAAIRSPARTQKVVPVGIPVGTRSSANTQRKNHQSQQQKQPELLQRGQKMQIRKRSKVESESEPEASDDEEEEDDSMDSLPPEIHRPKVPKTARKATLSSIGVKARKEKESGSIRDLTRAIVKFGEVYEQTETTKLQQLVEMEKQRMKFAKELELQRMQFFMKTQLEISQMKHHHHQHHQQHQQQPGKKSGVGGSDGNHHANSNSNNSDDSN